MSENGSHKTKQRSVERFLQPLGGLDLIQPARLGSFEVGGDQYSLARFTLRGPNSSEPIRIGLFAAIHGDEPAGTLACIRFLQELAGSPALAENFHLEIYPICNPTGFEDNTRYSRKGRDLNREFWRNSNEPEVRALEQELRTGHFSGLIQLHADDTSDGLYGFVRGHTLTENLLRPALREAGQILPRNVNKIIDGFAARDGIIYDSYDGVLAAPADMDPVPFEIILETPHQAALEAQVQAFQTALRVILREYRQLVAFAADI
jgi:hypothetical protein